MRDKLFLLWVSMNYTLDKQKIDLFYSSSTKEEVSKEEIVEAFNNDILGIYINEAEENKKKITNNKYWNHFHNIFEMILAIVIIVLGIKLTNKTEDYDDLKYENYNIKKRLDQYMEKDTTIIKFGDGNYYNIHK